MARKTTIKISLENMLKN